MHRTTIDLPSDLHRRAARAARSLGISLEAFVFEAIRARLGEEGWTMEYDPLFEDWGVFGGDAPVDLSEHHDRHLCG